MAGAKQCCTGGEFETWRDHWMSQKAVSTLLESGRPEARRLGQQKYASGNIAVEIDGLAVADDCAFIVEAEPILSRRYLVNFIEKLDRLRGLIRQGAGGTADLQDKKLMPVMADPYDVDVTSLCLTEKAGDN
ncbi:hypothetical protein WJX73_008946 [Symbiochloris irregularis]|uniref:Uncharacterized protein n=1 Tax=Symbiochloris irregularis TaxID=706552 RepID=A0AAW1NP79_9CHLO